MDVSEWTYACPCARVALLIRHAKLMRHIVSSLTASLATSHFSTLSHQRQDFREKKVIEHKTCVSIFHFSVGIMSQPRLLQLFYRSLAICIPLWSAVKVTD